MGGSSRREVWTPGALDAALLAAALFATLAIAMPIAAGLRRQVRDYDRARETSLATIRLRRATLEHVESRRAAYSRLRRAVDRYTADVEARPILPWGSQVRELADRRPEGLWVHRISGEGPRFRLVCRMRDPVQASVYAQNLRTSSFIEFIGGPTPTGTPGEMVITGRFSGE